MRRKSIVEEYSRNYREYLDKRELPKASKALWGMVNNLASILSILYQGKPVSGHKELRVFMKHLAERLRNEEILRWLRSCETLHANYLHGFMDEELFEEYRLEAEKLINELQRLIQRELEKHGIRI